MADQLVPIFLFIAISSIFWIIHHFRQRKNEEIHITLRAMIEKGQQLSPEKLEALNSNITNRKTKDLRRGVILISIGISITVFSLIVAGLSPNKFTMLLFGFSSAFVVLGLSYIGFWKFMPSSDKNENREVSL